jgi:hypothetical protein
MWTDLHQQVAHHGKPQHQGRHVGHHAEALGGCGPGGALQRVAQRLVLREECLEILRLHFGRSVPGQVG